MTSEWLPWREILRRLFKWDTYRGAWNDTEFQRGIALAEVFIKHYPGDLARLTDIPVHATAGSKATAFDRGFYCTVVHEVEASRWAQSPNFRREEAFNLRLKINMAADDPALWSVETIMEPAK